MNYVDYKEGEWFEAGIWPKSTLHKDFENFVKINIYEKKRGA